MTGEIQTSRVAPAGAAGYATFVCGGRNVPSARFRIDPIVRGLGARGWETATIYGYGDIDRRIGARPLRLVYRALCRVRRAALTSAVSGRGPVVLQRLAVPWLAWPELVAKRRGVALIFDFDDAIFLGSRGERSQLRSSALRRVFEAADHIVAGNSWLASFVPDAGKVTVLPTCIDASAYRPLTRLASGPPVIGWMGTGGNLKYLAALVEPLRRLRRDGHRFRFVIVSDVDDREVWRSLEAEFVRWSGERELALLQSYDVGVMPLADDDWCRGKCGFKLIQYMAIGAPVVASDVGFNSQVVRDGTDGYIVDSRGWYEALRALLVDEDLRRRMGRAGRRRVETNFGIARATDRYDQILRTLQ